MILRQLFDNKSSTYTYLIADSDSKEATLIDPVIELIDRDLTLINELGLTLKYTLDTHVHADHITANGEIRKRTGCETGISQAGDVACANLALNSGDALALGKHEINVIATPGHTDSCMSFHIGNHLFTGDSLLIRGCGRTDFQQGDAGKLYDSITQNLFTLPEKTWVHPGHDYHGRSLSTIGEENAHNPRLKLNRDQFIRYMANLNLPNPKKIMEAIPANQTCGQIA